MLTDTFIEQTLNDLDEDEGFRAYAYRCPAGLWTIGYGFNIDVQSQTGISEEEADFLLHRDMLVDPQYANMTTEAQNEARIVEKCRWIFNRYLEHTRNGWFIGYGRAVHPSLGKGLSKFEARYILQRRIFALHEAAQNKFKSYLVLSPERKSVILNMFYNMGLPRLQGFVKMWDAIQRGAIHTTVAEMRDSKWYREVPVRAEKLCQQYQQNKYRKDL